MVLTAVLFIGGIKACIFAGACRLINESVVEIFLP